MSLSQTVELLSFPDCPGHGPARALLDDVLADLGLGAVVIEIDARDPAVAAALRFPGSPTIRVDGRDIEPGFVDSGDHTPRCRLYLTERGLVGVPERRWIEDALRRTDQNAVPTTAPVPRVPSLPKKPGTTQA